MTPSARPHKLAKDPLRYKTVLCNMFEATGRCPYGPRCQFAHGASQLRERPPRKSSDETGSATDKEPTAYAQDGATSTWAELLRKQVAPCPPCAPASEDVQSRGRPETVAPKPEPVSRRDTQITKAGDLLLNSMGEVACRRDASHHTSLIAGVVSFVLDEDETAVNDTLGLPQPSPRSFGFNVGG
mmetsp:Transcript_22747/g.67010  ORF Transcript_22747/g.67010 Transcript_22747/m.67010 type:complete len:185 (+) Transcript_22747:58-612(+)